MVFYCTIVATKLFKEEAKDYDVVEDREFEDEAEEADDAMKVVDNPYLSVENIQDIHGTASVMSSKNVSHSLSICRLRSCHERLCYLLRLLRL